MWRSTGMCSSSKCKPMSSAPAGVWALASATTPMRALQYAKTPLAWDRHELIVVTYRHSTFHRRGKINSSVRHFERLGNARFDQFSVSRAHSFLEDMPEQSITKVRVFVLRPDIGREGKR